MKEGMGMRRIRRLLTALFAVALLFALPLTAHALEDYTYTYPENYAGRIDPSVPYDPLLEKDGVAPEDRHGGGEAAPRLPLFRAALSSTATPWYPRVLLSTPNTSLNVVFSGSYCLYGPSGQALINLTPGAVYTFTYASGSVTVSCNGTTLVSGLQFEAREHTPPVGQRSFFTLSGNNRSYLGSLFIYSTIGSGGGVYFINRVYMEDYLCGVVPYEIGEGYGAAALQAQAVVARNYAYIRTVKAAAYYDLGDTSTYQVYKGIGNMPNSEAAVEATKGKLLLYGGTPIEAFYSASNGGVTELTSHRWTVDHSYPPYIEIVEDPYDLNYSKNSTYLEEITVSQTGDSEGMLKTMLKNTSLALTEAEAASIQFTAVTLSADCLHNINYTEANGTVRNFAGFLDKYMNVKGAGHTYCSQFLTLTAVVSCTYVKDGKTCELTNQTVTIDRNTLGNGNYGFTDSKLTAFWLTDNGNSTYTIRRGRFGHGIGLSQIGARQMADEKKTAEFILTFYYPNTVLQEGAGFTGREALTALPEILPEQRALTCDAYVYADCYSDSLVLGVVRKGSALVVGGESGDYYKVTFNGKTGYVLKTAFSSNAGTTILDYIVSVTPPAGYTDTVLWVDGVSCSAVSANGKLSAALHDTGAKTVTMYKLDGGVMDEMYAWTLSYTPAAGYVATPLPSALQNLLVYEGCSIRITGNPGLRFISSIAVDAKQLLLQSGGFDGFRLKEYGTVFIRGSSYDVYPAVKGGYDTQFGRAYWGANNDYYLKIAKGRIQFASVMTNIQPKNYNAYYGFRAYMVLEKGGVEYTLYGGQVLRSMYYVAKQVMNSNEFRPGTAAYQFVQNIITTVDKGNG